MKDEGRKLEAIFSPKGLGRSLAATRSSSESARAAWVSFTWPSRPSRLRGKSPSKSSTWEWTPGQRRLELFIPVCQAIQHAHQKGVIHRDIKPSNVMITLHDGEPEPKVIDFGIAKATNQKLTEKTLFTQYAQMIGTPAYMSPEQAELSGLDIDTRTDVYALGVLLYELLTGTTPIPVQELLSLGYGEMQRTIVEKEPPRHSTRLSTMPDAERTLVGTHRSMESSALANLFKGDLDWIVMKALEKDRTRRYETVNGLVSDVKRHLNHEPVSAAAPTFGYQLGKF